MLICTQSNHNKYWDYEINPQTSPTCWVVTYSWGRIGTKGQTAAKVFATSYQANNDAHHKHATKINKGYRPATDEEVRLIELQAKILGTANKIEYCAIVTYDDLAITELSHVEAANPDLKAGIFVQFWYKKVRYSILFMDDDIYNILFARSCVPTLETRAGGVLLKRWTADGGRAKMNNSHKLWEFLEKLQEAVGAAL